MLTASPPEQGSATTYVKREGAYAGSEWKTARLDGKLVLESVAVPGLLHIFSAAQMEEQGSAPKPSAEPARVEGREALTAQLRAFEKVWAKGVPVDMLKSGAISNLLLRAANAIDTWKSGDESWSDVILELCRLYSLEPTESRWHALGAAIRSCASSPSEQAEGRPEAQRIAELEALIVEYYRADFSMGGRRISEATNALLNEGERLDPPPRRPQDDEAFDGEDQDAP